MRINTQSYNLINQMYNNPAGVSSKTQAGLIKQGNSKLTGGWSQGSATLELDSKTSVRKQMQEQLRELFEKERTKQAEALKDNANAVTGTEEKDDKEDKLLNSANTYNFKEVSNKIMRAKTSVSAGQAVVAARRKISELRRKLSMDTDNDDLQLALTHARKMEIVASRKKNNLELEEMAENTRKRDEQLKTLQDSASSLKNDEIEAVKDKITDEQLKNIEEQSEISREEARQNREKLNEKIEESRELTEQMMESTEELTDELSDAEGEMLREMSEMLDAMEVIDPHMSEEELNKLKTKHRLSENKALMKADLDYLKGVFKELDVKGANGMTTLGQGLSFGGTVSSGSLSSGAGGFSGAMGFAGSGFEPSGAAPSVSVDVAV